MKMIKWMTLSLGLVLASPAGAEPAHVERYEGIAETPGGQFLYRETHELTESGGKPVRAVTVYYDRGGKEIGRLTSDCTRSPYAPTYRFEDKRTGQREGATVSGNRVNLDYRGDRRTLPVPDGQPLVVGQGLHHFARMNLARLARESVTVSFAVPSRLDTYTFRIRPLDPPAPGVVRLRIEIDNWIMRQLAPHLEVDYDVKSRRLLRYRGVSNLEAADGSTQKVVIRYRYPGGSS
jgi:hypothetical protein